MMVTSEVRRGGTTCGDVEAIVGEGHLSGVGRIFIFRCAGNISFPCGRLRAEVGNNIVPVGNIEGAERPR